MSQSQTSITRRGFVVIALLWAIVASSVVVATAPSAQAAITPAAFESCLLQRINTDRAAAGAPGLVLATDLTDEVRDWSAWMSDNTFRHMNRTERNPILPNATFTWGENISWTSNRNLPDCASIHTGLMNSSGHRANILNPSFRYVALGAHVDSSGWWITELFFNADGYSARCDGRFCDDDTSIFEADIEKIAAAGITKGCNPPANDRFCANAYVTRGMMAAFLVRALGLTSFGSADFVDDNHSTFESDIERLAAAGITKGCNPPANDRFCPDSYVTRGSMAAFLTRALGLTRSGSVDFIDDNHSTFESDIEKIAAVGITKGCNPPANNRFCPDSYVTRGTMAAFLSRALDL
jgi:ribosomal protein L30/L7E